MNSLTNIQMIEFNHNLVIQQQKFSWACIRS